MESITAQKVECECGWCGDVIDCLCDADVPALGVRDEGRLRCPACTDVIEVIK